MPMEMGAYLWEGNVSWIFSQQKGDKSQLAVARLSLAQPHNLGTACSSPLMLTDCVTHANNKDACSLVVEMVLPRGSLKDHFYTLLQTVRSCTPVTCGTETK